MTDDDQSQTNEDERLAAEAGEQKADEQDDNKAKVYKEEVKDQQTTHWDMDYMTQAEIDEAYKQEESKDDEEKN